MKNSIPKILVVDDEYYNFQLISELLSDYKIDFLYASCGSDAIELSIKNKDLSLVFMDIKMKGMNGFETTLRIKEFNNKIPIVFQTAYAKEFINDEVIKTFCAGVLEKPLKMDKLIKEVKKNIPLQLKESEKKTEPDNIFQNFYRFLF